MIETQTKQNRWALLIGINTYPNLLPRYQLNGCVNDMQLIERILKEQYGFTTERGQVRTLSNKQATRETILKAMDALVEQAGHDDIVVLYYSGHGSQIRDREGDEPDGWDETIVPYDSGRGEHPNQDITDDEIYVRLRALAQKTPYITLIFDCCNSGHITRDSFGTTARWVERDERMDQLPPPCEFSAEVKAELRGETRDLGPSAWLPLGDRHVLIAGCRSDESSYEHRVDEAGQTITHGALTYFLSRKLIEAKTALTYRELFEQVEASVTAIYPRQHPQLEGRRDRLVFGVQDIQPMQFVSVLQRQQDHIMLKAGAAHGMTLRSQWAIYPEGTRVMTDGTARLGIVEVDRVHALTAEAILKEEVAPGSIQASARAVEVAHHFGAMCLKVDIQPQALYIEAVVQLKGKLATQPLLSVVTPGEAADVRIYCIPPRSQVEAHDPVPHLGRLDRASWAVVGQDGRLLLPIHPAGESSDERQAALTLLTENLVKLVRYRLTLALTNPNTNSVLQGKVSMLLKRQSADGTMLPIPSNPAGGQVMLKDGDTIEIEIRNNHEAPIYVAIFDFGLTGRVEMLYPWEGSNKPLAENTAVTTTKFDLQIPLDFPFVRDPVDSAPSGGTETLKLFATLSSTDFSMFIQSAFKGLAPAPNIDHLIHAVRSSPSLSHHDYEKTLRSPLGQLLALTTSGIGTRDARPVQVPQEEEWTTVSQSFFLRR